MAFATAFLAHCELAAGAILEHTDFGPASRRAASRNFRTGS